MKTSSKKTLLIIGGLGLVGIAAYYATRKPQPQFTPGLPAPSPIPSGTTPPYLPPPTETPAPVIPSASGIKIGDKLKMKSDSYMFNGPGMTKAYEYGGTDNDGVIEADSYAGTVIDINTLYKSVRVRNFTVPAAYDAPGVGTGEVKVYEYWLPLAAVKKS